MTGRNDWSDADRAALARLWPSGLSTREIGDRLGRGRNAVISRARADRLGPHPSAPARNTVPPRAPAPHRQAPDGNTGDGARAGTVALLDLGPRGCRWPFGDPRDADFGFCGRPAAPGASYCTAHRARAWAGKPDPAGRRSVPIWRGNFGDKRNKAVIR